MSLWPRDLTRAGLLALTVLSLLDSAHAQQSRTDPLVAQADQINKAYEAGKCQDVLNRGRPLAEQMRRQWGENNIVLASVLEVVGLCTANAGGVKDADALYRRVLAIREKLLGPNHVNVAYALLNLANTLVDEAAYTEATALFQRAQPILQKASGADSLDVAIVMDGLATIYEATNRYADAEPLRKRALAIREKNRGPNDIDVANTLNGLAFLEANLGHYGDAEAYNKRALAIREKVLGANDNFVAVSLNNLAEVYRNTARYSDAEPLYRRAIAIWEKNLGPDHPNVAAALNNLGIIALSREHYSDAEALYQRALAIHEKSSGPESADVGRVLGNLANVYRETGRFDEAELLYKRALAVREKALGPTNPEVATALNDLAATYWNQQRFAETIPLYQRALAIREQAFGPDHDDVGVLLNNLGRSYVDLGRFAEAEPVLRRSLAIAEKGLGPNHPGITYSLSNLAQLYQKMGRLADAEVLFQRSLVIRNQVYGEDHLDVASSLDDIGNLKLASGDVRAALDFSRRAITLVTGRMARDSGAELSADTSFLLLFLERNLAILTRAVNDKILTSAEAGAEAFEVSQLGNQSAAAAALNQMVARFAAGSDALAAVVRDRQDADTKLQALNKELFGELLNPAATRNSAREDVLRRQISDATARIQGLSARIAAEFPNFAALATPQPLKVEQVQRLLSADEVVIFIYGTDDETYVFAATREGFAWKAVHLRRDELTRKVATFRRGLDVEELNRSIQVSGKPQLFDLDAAYDLYAQLLQPVEQLAIGKKLLIVVPSGATTAVSFQLLLTEPPRGPAPTVKDVAGYRDAAWLIKRQAVSVLPSVASLTALRSFAAKDRAPKPLVGFGNPVFNAATAAKTIASAAGPNPKSRTATSTRAYTDYWQGAGVDREKLGLALPALPDTADELYAVAQKLGAAPGDIHLGNDASETTLKSVRLADYRIIYFATHGLVAGDVKGLAEPSLVLTIPPQPSSIDDGLLTASEIAQLTLNADWVVLSACNTAAGDKPGAEALSGLVRAFFYAGARALLVSHWAVASDAATRLTTSTFDLIKNDRSLGKAEASRRSMLAYLSDTTQPFNAYPAMWAPFEIVGEGTAN
jgi:CHAT domain-containing protein/Tfp pilus assembly protein PilF